MDKRCAIFYLTLIIFFGVISPPDRLYTHPLDITYTTLIPKSTGFKGATFIHPYELNLLGTSQAINIHTEKDVDLLSQIIMPYFKDNFRVYANKKLIELENLAIEKKTLAEILADGVYLKFFIPKIAGQQDYEFQVTLFNTYFTTQSNKVLLLDSLGKVVPERPEIHFTPKRKIWILNLINPDFSADIDDKVDSDKDGLSDHLENLYGMDPSRVDTDGDQFSDFDEYIMGWPPLDSRPVKGQKIMYLNQLDLLNSVYDSPVTFNDSARYYNSDEPVVFPLKISKDSVVKKIVPRDSSEFANSSVEKISRLCFNLFPNLNFTNLTAHAGLIKLYLGLFFLLGVIHVTRRNIPKHPFLFHLFEFKLKKRMLILILLSYTFIYLADVILVGVLFWSINKIFNLESWLIFLQLAGVIILGLLLIFNLVHLLVKFHTYKKYLLQKGKTDNFDKSISNIRSTPGTIFLKSITPFSCKWIMVSLLVSIGAFELFHISILIFMAGIILSLLFYTIGVRLFYHRIHYYFRTVGIFAIMITGVMTFLLLLAFLFPAV
ncbi:hypothetical protein JW964_04195 [candidate division KSB1 bacterium]|nr:hypothetical protein [candidate division KSB1 bacterium]